MGDKFDSSKCFPRKMWAFISPGGELLPSTIREKEGDSRSCLEKYGAKYRHDLRNCTLIRVTVDIADPDTQP